MEEQLPEFKTKLSKDWLHNEIFDNRGRQIQEAYQRKLKISNYPSSLRSKQNN